MQVPTTHFLYDGNDRTGNTLENAITEHQRLIGECNHQQFWINR